VLRLIVLQLRGWEDRKARQTIQRHVHERSGSAALDRCHFFGPSMQAARSQIPHRGFAGDDQEDCASRGGARAFAQQASG
jgi:hypothetical protein